MRFVIRAAAFVLAAIIAAVAAPLDAQEPITLNAKADGYRGIWYMNQPSKDEYVYKYSGGLGTYCAKHKPFAVYCEEADKTFFCYGGATIDNNRKLLHMVSYYDHKTGRVPRPTILLDKKTRDAHDNPVISVDDSGHVWIFSTSHGTSRPSYIHRSTRPHDVEEFELIQANYSRDGQRAALDNFSYMQSWWMPRAGFLCFFTRYGDPAPRTIGFLNSADGVSWGEWRRLAAIDEGHYQVSGVGLGVAGTAFNYHPAGKGLNWRTNVYYMQTRDNGATWQTADGRRLEIPLTEVANPALARDYASEGLVVYVKDIRFDEHDRPVILYLTSQGYESGPKNDPRTWMLTRWNGQEWLHHAITQSDNNYDVGELWMCAANDWRIVAPTTSGPQPYNPGGEVAMWTSQDQGATWELKRRMTVDSPRNHTYVRRPLNSHPDFFAFWADGHGRRPSESRLYFSDQQGNVRVLPREMTGDFAIPEVLATK